MVQSIEKNEGFSLRAMTYNIHSCIGLDKEVNPQRVASVIKEAKPDIVALQEVDKGIPRTRHQDQTELLADILSMDAHFFPVVSSGNQKYGLAVLSRFKLTDVHRDLLPMMYPRRYSKFSRPRYRHPFGCKRKSTETESACLVKKVSI